MTECCEISFDEARDIPGVYDGRLDSSDGRGGGILTADLGGKSTRGLSTGVIGAPVNPYWRASRGGLGRAFDSSVGGNERSEGGKRGGSRDTGVPNPKARASLTGAVKGGSARDAAATVLTSRAGCGGG